MNASHTLATQPLVENLVGRMSARFLNIKKENGYTLLEFDTSFERCEFWAEDIIVV